MAVAPGAVGAAVARGWHNRYWATGQPGWARAGLYPTAWPVPPLLTRAQEIELLRDQAQSLQSTLEDTQRRLRDLEGKRGEKE